MYKQNTCNYGTAILLSLIVGIGVSILFSLGLLPLIFIGIWVAFGIAAVVLFTFTILLSILSISPFAYFKKAMRIFGKGIIIGSVGTIVTALAAFSTILLPFITASIFIVLFVALFFTFMLVSLVQMLFFLIHQDTCCH